MKNEFALAFNEVLEEKQLPREVILNALEAAMVSAYRKAVNASGDQHVEAQIDFDCGKVTIYAEKEVVDRAQYPLTEISFDEAIKVNPNTELGSLLVVESTPRDFGRIAAQTARQVIQTKIREAEKHAQLVFFEKQLGEIISGVVQATSAQGLTIGLEMKTEGILLRKDMITNEKFKTHERVRALVAEVKDSPRGVQVVLSRTHRNFLRRLLETEVPEIYRGVVEIRSIAREPGERAKVAVSATQSGIDPVGACVGIRGVRIQAIVRELHGEKIDVIEFSQDPEIYISKAISPARVCGVYINEKTLGGKTATVVVPEDQLSLAIGSSGQNARLAAKLTGWRIDIKSLPEASIDSLNKLHEDPTFAVIADTEKINIPIIDALLAKKAEGKALTPEEYDIITKFVDRVERRSALKTHEEQQAEEDYIAHVRRSIHPSAFQQNILDSGLSDHVVYTLQEAGIATVGHLALQVKIQPDDILRLQGIGPRAMVEIKRLVDSVPEATADAVITNADLMPKEDNIESIVTDETLLSSDSVESSDEATVSSPADQVPLETIATEESVTVVTDQPLASGDEQSQPGEEIEKFEEIFSLREDILSSLSRGNETEQTDDLRKGKKKKKKAHRSEPVSGLERDILTGRKKYRLTDGEWED